MQKSRPRGITILAILIIISGIISIFGIASGPLGIISVALGIIYIIMGYGLFKGKSWAWTGTVVSYFAGIAISIISTIIGIYILPADIQFSSIVIGTYVTGLVISIGFAAVILYYLYRPHIKTYFGKSASVTGGIQRT